MKKVFLIIAVVFMAFTAKSQLTYGPKVGFDVTNLTKLDYKNKIGLTAGGFVTIDFNDWMKIQPELMYTCKGGRDKVDNSEGGKDMKYKFRVNYLNIPVLARFFVLDGLSVDFGPQVGIGLGGKAISKVGSTKTTTKLDGKDGRPQMNAVDFGFVIGASYDYDVFEFSARYDLGLTRVIKKDNYIDAGCNRGAYFTVGYRFGDLF